MKGCTWQGAGGRASAACDRACQELAAAWCSQPCRRRSARPPAGSARTSTLVPAANRLAWRCAEGIGCRCWCRRCRRLWPAAPLEWPRLPAESPAGAVLSTALLGPPQHARKCTRCGARARGGGGGTGGGGAVSGRLGRAAASFGRADFLLGSLKRSQGCANKTPQGSADRAPPSTGGQVLGGEALKHACEDT